MGLKRKVDFTIVESPYLFDFIRLKWVFIRNFLFQY